MDSIWNATLSDLESSRVHLRKQTLWKIKNGSISRLQKEVHMNDLTLLDDEAFAEKLEQQWHELLAEQSTLALL